MAMDNATMNSRLLVILIVIVGLISAVGVIISAVALGRPSLPTVSISQTANSRPLASDWLNQIPGRVTPPVESTTTTEPQSATAPTTSTTTPASGRRRRDLTNTLHFQPGPWGGAGSHQAPTVWTIAVGFDNGPHDYRDPEGGVAGFSSEVVHAVCSSLGLNCRLVSDAYQNCWTTTDGHYPSGGKGLLGQWYDGCVGWTPTRDRVNVFDFSHPYATPGPAKLYVLMGATLDLSNIATQTIGFVRGFAEDEGCLSRELQAPALAAGSVVYADTPQQAAQLLKEGKVAAVFVGSDVMQPYLDDVIVAVADSGCTCTDGGYGLMTRKDNNFLALWNIGFQQIKKNGLYKTICENTARHAPRGSVACIED